MSKHEQNQNYEARTDQSEEVQLALGKLAVSGETLDLDYLRNGGLNKKLGAAALNAAIRSEYELAA